jgi:hypothetical protein
MTLYPDIKKPSPNPPKSYLWNPSAEMSPTWSHSFRFSVQIFVHIFHSHMCAIWPTHITLLELIPLLHNIQTVIIWRTCEVLSWIMKTQASHTMFSFLCYENWQMTIKFLSVHTSTKHSPCFLSHQEIFLQLSGHQISWHSCHKGMQNRS